MILNAADALGRIGGDGELDFLISLLELDDTAIRNCAALALEERKDNRALEPLLKAIFKKENHNRNGTMVFALSSLDCSQYLVDIFRILFYETYESIVSAYAILLDQDFAVTEDHIIQIAAMWEQCKLFPQNCPGLDNEHNKAMIKDAVERFIATETI